MSEVLDFIFFPDLHLVFNLSIAQLMKYPIIVVVAFMINLHFSLMAVGHLNPNMCCSCVWWHVGHHTQDLRRSMVEIESEYRK